MPDEGILAMYILMTLLFCVSGTLLARIFWNHICYRLGSYQTLLDIYLISQMLVVFTVFGHLLYVLTMWRTVNAFTADGIFWSSVFNHTAQLASKTALLVLTLERCLIVIAPAYYRRQQKRTMLRLCLLAMAVVSIMDATFFINNRPAVMPQNPLQGLNFDLDFDFVLDFDFDVEVEVEVEVFLDLRRSRVNAFTADGIFWSSVFNHTAQLASKTALLVLTLERCLIVIAPAYYRRQQKRTMLRLCLLAMAVVSIMDATFFINNRPAVMPQNCRQLACAITDFAGTVYLIKTMTSGAANAIASLIFILALYRFDQRRPKSEVEKSRKRFKDMLVIKLQSLEFLCVFVSTGTGLFIKIVFHASLAAMIGPYSHLLISIECLLSSITYTHVFKQMSLIGGGSKKIHIKPHLFLRKTRSGSGNRMADFSSATHI
ncbi:hypothetical protein AAVH_29013 [Aphelenchoides avenae]|nr:hypothetical protein AAVH_29013 [Aphelenchus avenae]